MTDSLSADARLALDLALTVRHDGRGGVADDLATARGLTAWVAEHPEAVSPVTTVTTVAPGSGATEPTETAGSAGPAGIKGIGSAEFRADDAALAAVREVRAAVRALFAHAVRPDEPSPADAGRLIPMRDAVELLNARAALVPTVPVLSWTEGAEPVVRQEPFVRQESVVRQEPFVRHEPLERQVPAHDGSALASALARAAIAFLASPDRQRLRACHAPRCVRYFLKDHPRQEWCKPSCGNRARVARHHERHKKTA
ncbi:CGNR zinc finger domain-containing protein [Streptomyces sp. NPDC127119]|uniref:CGNR zinc finger domain-containing protein n=1 Tax=Streptomyces sp. NPDC127119 TaxID=3345370 RepID=UPI0036368C84